MNFETLLQKSKKDLVRIADDIKSPNQKSKKELIELLANPPLTDIEFSILYLNHSTDNTWSYEIRNKCQEVNVEYTTVNESAIRLVNHLEVAPEVNRERIRNTNETKSFGDVEQEYQKAINVAIQNVKQENRSYHILQNVNETNHFKIQPMYMNLPDEDEWLLRMTIINHDLKPSII